MRARLVQQRGRVLEPHGRGRHRGTVSVHVQVLAAQVTVVGAGAAGLYTAVCAAREGARVTLVSATPLAESSSWWAQGGLAAAVSA
ncbi:MAG TPA: FAD-dependent oxidoreductase, partial [Solirubrobacteraceae bacterium]|nr:FAD-dependent oxidoreductase [Solirubrobacteraceae bacterium]